MVPIRSPSVVLESPGGCALPISFGIVSTFPPTQCGLATFSEALLRALRTVGANPGVISIVDSPDTDAPDVVSHEWVRSDPDGAIRAAAAVDAYDIAIIQHEYGIFPGRDGIDVLDFARAVTCPVITVLHTVLETPSPRQRLILETLGRYSVALVTMTETGRQRLIEHYRVDPAIVHVIPHGSADHRSDGVARTDLLPDRPAILTWGLLGEGKGIEWAIQAMAQLTDLDPHYYVVGETHPRVVEKFGEVYRESLVGMAASLGIAHSVHFEGRYLTNEELDKLIQQADIVLLPYDSSQQVTSGVLIEAVAAGKPVVSTAFPHAVELLSGGAGLLVERKNPTAIAEALRRVLTEPGLSDSMAAEADRIAPSLLWPAVAESYCNVARTALQRSALPATA
jgi:glycosyltransferase involved in cell wall biosynthesis